MATPSLFKLKRLKISSFVIIAETLEILLRAFKYWRALESEQLQTAVLEHYVISLASRS